MYNSIVARVYLLNYSSIASHFESVDMCHMLQTALKISQM